MIVIEQWNVLSILTNPRQARNDCRVQTIVRRIITAQ